MKNLVKFLVILFIVVVCYENANAWAICKLKITKCFKTQTGRSCRSRVIPVVVRVAKYTKNFVYADTNGKLKVPLGFSNLVQIPRRSCKILINGKDKKMEAARGSI